MEWLVICRELSPASATSGDGEVESSDASEESNSALTLLPVGALALLAGIGIQYKEPIAENLTVRGYSYLLKFSCVGQEGVT